MNDLLKSYSSEGIVKLKLPDEIIDLSTQFLNEIRMYLDFYFGNKFEDLPIEKRLYRLAVENRAEIGKLYNVSRRFPSMKKLACQDWFLEIAKELMQTQLVSCCNFVAARFDFPNESKYATVPHQDFPYIQGSPDAITVWLPFVDVPFSVGAPSYVPGSHSQGPQPIVEKEIDASNGTASISARDLDKWQSLEYKKVNVSKNECLIFSTNLVHQSEPNLSDYCRITTQLRFDNLANNISWSKNFPEGLYLNQKLSESYPELVV
jgi:ectoine hydroxylase-related dioxygenase (phytanoyl-CoA dioxygenase family)